MNTTMQRSSNSVGSHVFSIPIGQKENWILERNCDWTQYTNAVEAYKKIESLLASYRRERNREVKPSGGGSDKIYYSKWLQFLNDKFTRKPRPTKDKTYSLASTYYIFILFFILFTIIGKLIIEHIKYICSPSLSLLVRVLMYNFFFKNIRYKVYINT